MKNSIKLAVAALAIGGTVAGLATLALKDNGGIRHNISVYAGVSTTYSTKLQLRYDNAVYHYANNYLKQGDDDAYFTVSWTDGDSTQFTIQTEGGKYLACNSSTKLRLTDDAFYWYTDDERHIIAKTTTRYLGFYSDQNQVRAYATMNFNQYPTAYLYTEEQFNARQSTCNWDEFQVTCLKTLY